LVAFGVPPVVIDSVTLGIRSPVTDLRSKILASTAARPKPVHRPLRKNRLIEMPPNSK
jgi:hypothetical protein